MTRTLHIERFEPSPSFQSGVRALPENVRVAANDALKLLKQNPSAKSLRLHTLKGIKKPTIWKIDVFSNHSWQITFELDGDMAVLRRVATHAEIDRRPR